MKKRDKTPNPYLISEDNQLEHSSNQTARTRAVLRRIQAVIDDTYQKSSVKFQIVSVIPNFYQGWEMDEFHYIVKTEDKRLWMIESDHGVLIREDDANEFIKMLQINAARYIAAARMAHEAVDLLSRENEK